MRKVETTNSGLEEGEQLFATLFKGWFGIVHFGLGFVNWILVYMKVIFNIIRLLF